MSSTLDPPLIVVGSGIAGLCTALAAAPRPVLLLGRGLAGSDSASRLAQGGIAAALGQADSIADHIDDTLRCGAGSNHVAAVSYLCAQAPAAIDWLRELGARFDHDENGDLQLAREGGHRRARVLHIGGDASGAGLLQVLQAAVRRAPHIHWREQVTVEALLQRGDHVVGVAVRDTDDYRESLPAAAVVLATGGIGGLFAATSNPVSAQGMGLALAQQVGAPLRDLELIQFHPTALALTTGTGPQRALITEALRGAGARLVDEQGRAVMSGVHPLADLAPRDLVSRQLWQLQQQGHALYLDARALAIDWPRQFPTVLGSCLAAGFDPRRQLIPVTPAAHFHMGGIACDLDGASTRPGLYAVGEVAGNGVHGGNRLASNALLEGVVMGRRLGQRLATGVPGLPASGRTALAALPAAASPADLACLRTLLWQGLGPVRSGTGLAQAQATLQACPRLAASWQGRLAQALLASAMARRDSGGAHWRADAEPAASTPAASTLVVNATA